jgi:hypothetical protein
MWKRAGGSRRSSIKALIDHDLKERTGAAIAYARRQVQGTYRPIGLGIAGHDALRRLEVRIPSARLHTWAKFWALSRCGRRTVANPMGRTWLKRGYPLTLPGNPRLCRYRVGFIHSLAKKQ